MDEKLTKDDGVFILPSLPPPLSSTNSENLVKQVNKKVNDSQLALNYTAPEWSSIPIDPTGDNILDEQGYCSHYFLEVIKTGSVVDKIKLDKEFVSFGRLDKCDILCEHPSLSRFHAILQYSNGEIDKNFPEGFYVYDLGSTHGTYINKTRLEPNKYVPINLDSMIKFGLSTRFYVLHGPKSKTNTDDLKINLTHEQMRKIKEKYNQMSIKLKVRKEIEQELAQETKPTSASWGMANDDEEIEDKNSKDNGDDINPFSVIEEEDESFYSSDPRKALKHFFERESEELIYDVEELSIGKFKCTIQLPIQNKFGNYMSAEVQHEGKKKDAMTMCALEACRILNAENVLKQSKQDIIKHRKEKNWESADFYDSDDDTYLDRTGDVEKKRLQRMAQAGKLTDEQNSSNSSSSLFKNKTHTFESLLNDIKIIMKEKHEITTKLEKCKAVMKAVEDDDLDSYIESLKVGNGLDTLTRAKMKKRTVEINNELTKLEKLLNICKPPGFDINKWKEEVNNQLETYLTKPEIKIKEEIKQVEIQSEIKPKSPLPPTVDVSQASSDPIANNIIPPIKPDEKQISKVKRKDQDQLLKKTHIIDDLNSNMKSKKFKVNNSEEEIIKEEYTDSKDYHVWLPPQDQSGDGKTKLNEKYGY